MEDSSMSRGRSAEENSGLARYGDDDDDDDDVDDDNSHNFCQGQKCGGGGDA